MTLAGRGRLRAAALLGTRLTTRFATLFTALLLAACSVLPQVIPDLRLPRGQAVQIDGAHGPLSATRSRAILARLAASGVPTGVFERHLAIEDALVGSPLTAGNSVRLLQDGPATYTAMLAAIEDARDHIHLETYILDADPVGRRFAQALLERQRAGVQVVLIRDSVGTFGTPLAFFDALAASGVQILEFNPINPLDARTDWQWNRRDHRKLLIVDGRTAILGGINISSVYSGGSFGSGLRRGRGRTVDPDDHDDPDDGLPPDAKPASTDAAWRDTDVQLQGPVVAELQKLFLAQWQAQRGAPLAVRDWFPAPERVGNQVVRAIGSSPEEPYSLIHATLLSAIGNAETHVHLTNAYFAPDPQLLAALVEAAGRGVDVQLVLPGRTDSWLVFHAGRAAYAQLLRAGVHIHERRGAILHAKTALVDGVWATVGSTNLDWRSVLHNHELDLVVLGPDFGAQLQAMFARDLAQSDEVTLTAWSQRPLHLRLAEWFARLWEYWL